MFFCLIGKQTLDPKRSISFFHKITANFSNIKNTEQKIHSNLLATLFEGWLMVVSEKMRKFVP